MIATSPIVASSRASKMTFRTNKGHTLVSAGLAPPDLLLTAARACEPSALAPRQSPSAGSAYLFLAHQTNQPLRNWTKSNLYLIVLLFMPFGLPRFAHAIKGSITMFSQQLLIILASNPPISFGTPSLRQPAPMAVFPVQIPPDSSVHRKLKYTEPGDTCSVRKAVSQDAGGS